MIIEIGTTRGYAADLIAVKIIKSLVKIKLKDTFDGGGLLNKTIMNEISILTGGAQMVKTLRLANAEETLKHIYIVTETRSDARAIYNALLRWSNDLDHLINTMRQLDTNFKDPIWDGFPIENIAMDIMDILTASIIIFPEELSPKTFRGTMSWLET